ncbi:MAG: mannose-6-phosphate isomerase, class I [Reichenbachiella sp.]
MSKLFALTGKVQHYAWGGIDYIADLIGVKKDDQPNAEYWLGAHDNAPSFIQMDDKPVGLNDFVESNPLDVLGNEIKEKFGKLPFLFKVLDVHDMLSIQVHPTKTEAIKGFAKENELGIDVKAAHRNYKDDNHKPEIMVALSEFWLLHGFLPDQKMKANLKNTPELSHLLPLYESEGYYGLYKTVMEESAEETNSVLQPLIDRVLPQYLAGKLDKSNPDYWTGKAFETFCPTGDVDKGIYSIYFFNIVKANPGEAVFQDAGIPHAYIEGQNMELMANSDNVLRGGLTPKHVDVPELLKHVVFEETHPNIMNGELQEDGVERIYKSPAPDFELSKIELNQGGNYQSTSDTIEILMVIDGEVSVSEGEQVLKMKKGEAFMVTAGASYQIKSTEKTCIIYKATAG